MDAPIKQLIVLDDIRDRLEMINSDIKPGSTIHPVEACTQNVASNVYSKDGTSYNGDFVTVSLSPLAGNVLNVDKTSIHTKFVLRPSIVIHNPDDTNALPAAGKAGSIIRGDFGPDSTSSMFSRVDFLIGGTSIFSTQFQQLESAIGVASLPADITEHSSMYSTIDKSIANKDSPAKLIELNVAGLPKTQYAVFNLELLYDLVVDVNRLMVALSDIHFITKNMGQITLRLYFNKAHEAWKFTHLPDGITAADNIGTSALVQRLPVIWNTKTYKIARPGSDFKYVELQFFTTYRLLKDSTNTNPPVFYNSGRNFFDLLNCDICQECFTIEDESYEQLERFFIDNDNKVIIPVHVLSTTIFSNGALSPLKGSGTGYPPTLNAQVSNQNITKLFVSQYLTYNQSTILNPYFQSFTLYYNGVPINQKPYEKINQRAINDFTQTMLDTDAEEINNDYLASLSFNSRFLSSDNKATETTPEIITDKENEYFQEKDVEKYLKWNARDGYNGKTIKLPHLCPLAFNTAVDGSFQTGLCVNNQGAGVGTQQVRLVNTTPYTNPSSPWSSNISRSDYTIPNPLDDETTTAITAFMDACIILQYDPIRHYCINGMLSYVKPYVPVE